jgi:hypothetical protein
VKPETGNVNYTSVHHNEAGLSVGIQVQIEVADRGDALFGASAAVRAKWIGGYVDIRASSVLMGEPREVTRRKRVL